MNQPALFDLTDAGQPVRPLVEIPEADLLVLDVYVPDADQPTLPGLEEL